MKLYNLGTFICSDRAYDVLYTHGTYEVLYRGRLYDVLYRDTL